MFSVSIGFHYIGAGFLPFPFVGACVILGTCPNPTWGCVIEILPAMTLECWHACHVAALTWRAKGCQGKNCCHIMQGSPSMT